MKPQSPPEHLRESDQIQDGDCRACSESDVSCEEALRSEELSFELMSLQPAGKVLQYLCICI